MSRLHQRLLRSLLADIVDGRMLIGSLLPSESELAATFAVSRGVARESLRGLEERGLVTVRHGRGASVNERAQWDAFSPDVLTALLQSRHRLVFLADFLECRRLLEVQAAGMAAERAEAADVDAIAAALDRMRQFGTGRHEHALDEDRFHAADLEFHREIVGATHNAVLARMIAPLQQAFAAMRRPLARPELRAERALPEHERILVAVRAADPLQARAAMAAHLDTVAGYLRELEVQTQPESVRV